MISCTSRHVDRLSFQKMVFVLKHPTSVCFVSYLMSSAQRYQKKRRKKKKKSYPSWKLHYLVVWYLSCVTLVEVTHTTRILTFNNVVLLFNKDFMGKIVLLTELTYHVGSPSVIPCSALGKTFVVQAVLAYLIHS